MRFTVSSSLVTNNSQVPRVAGAKSPQAAVFDCDGLLVDSQHCWERAYAQVAAARGHSLDGIRLERLLGASVAIAARVLGEELGQPVSERELRGALADQFAAAPPRALRGACELVAELSARMPLGVASNGPRDVVVGVLEQLGLRAAFTAVMSAEETAGDKPAPYVYLAACRQLGVAPACAVALEDSPLGARAARTAGLALVLVTPDPPLGADADLVVPSLDDDRLRAFLGLSDPDRIAPRAAAVGVDERHAAEAPAEV